jgi:hypothetical protein
LTAVLQGFHSGDDRFKKEIADMERELKAIKPLRDFRRSWKEATTASLNDESTQTEGQPVAPAEKGMAN